MQQNVVCYLIAIIIRDIRTKSITITGAHRYAVLMEIMCWFLPIQIKF